MNPRINIMKSKYKDQPEGSYDKNDLIAVARRGHTQESIKLLEEQKQDVDQKNWCGSTALIGATTYGHIDTVEMLLKHKANPNLPTTRGIIGPALHCAASKNDADIILILLEHKADPIIRCPSAFFNRASHYAEDHAVIQILKMAEQEMSLSFSRGAILGALNNMLVENVFRLLGEFLSLKEGAALAQTCKLANEQAKSEINNMSLARK